MREGSIALPQGAQKNPVARARASRFAGVGRRIVIALALAALFSIAWWAIFYGNLALDSEQNLFRAYWDALPCFVWTTPDCSAIAAAQPDPFLVFSWRVPLITAAQLVALAVFIGYLSNGAKIWIYRLFALELFLVVWWAFSSTNSLIPSPAEAWNASGVLLCGATTGEGSWLARSWTCITGLPDTSVWHALFGIERAADGSLRQLGSVFLYLAAFVVSGVTGIFIGLLLGGFRPFGRTMEIYVNALMATPRIAFIPLITVVLGIFWEAKIFIIFLGAVFPIIVNTYAGVHNADGELVEMARSSGAKRLQIFRRVLLPGSLPFIVVGLRLGATIGLINTVVAELYVSVSGLGGLLSQYRGSFRMAEYSVIVVVLAIIGIIVTQTLRQLESRMDRWRYSNR
jgi:NitT/TauT family transport system permease protein